MRGYLHLLVVAVILLSASLKLPHAVFVENQDEFSRVITLYVDGSRASTVYVPPESKKLITYYYLKEGTHKFEIVTQDNCGGTVQNSYTLVVSGREPVVLNLSTGRRECPPKRIGSYESEFASLSVNIRNPDDDPLFMRLDISQRYYSVVTRFLSIKPQEERVISFRLKKGNYTASILWADPDEAGVKRQSKEVELSRDSEVTLSTYRVEKYAGVYNPQGRISVIVENRDDDDLWVDVFVDDYTKTKYVPAGQKKFFGEFNRLPKGEHKIVLRWLDPDIYRYEFKDKFSRKVYTVELPKDGEVQITVSTERLE